MGDYFKDGVPFNVKFDSQSSIMLGVTLFVALLLALVIAGKIVK